MTPLRTFAIALAIAAALPPAWAQDDAASGAPDLDGIWKICTRDGKPLTDSAGNEYEIDYTPTWFCQWSYQVYRVDTDGVRHETRERGTVEEWITGFCVWTNSKGGTGTMVWNEKEKGYDTHSNTTGDERRFVRP